MKKKSLWNCYTSFECRNIKPTRIFLFELRSCDKLEFRGSEFEAAAQLQIEVRQKMLGSRSVTGVKSVLPVSLE